MKKTLCMILALCMVLALLAACGAKTEQPAASSAPAESASQSAPAELVEKLMTPEQAAEAVEAAMETQIDKMFGDKVTEYRIFVEKVYTPEEEQEDELIKSYELGDDEYAFEVKYELKPAEGEDTMQFTAGTGTVDETTGWIVEKYNVGILRPATEGDAPYTITDFGTGF